MCGRYTLHHSVEEVADRFAVQEVLFEFPDRYNIAPMQPIAVVTQNAHGDGVRALEGYRWGLVPPWAKDDSMGAKMINARLETLTEKASFKHAIKRKRCIIPADGFYEWKTEGRSKTPYHVRFKDSRLWGFAGLWEEWNGPGDSPLRTATIITSLPNGLLSSLHHRMAVMLRPEDENAWLDPNLSVADALDLLQTYPDDDLEAYPIDKRVGNVVNDDANLICSLTESVPETSDGQLTLL